MSASVPEPVPADVVPMRSADLSALAPGDRVGDVLLPGEILTDVDGWPLAVGPSERLHDVTLTDTGGVVGWEV